MKAIVFSCDRYHAMAAHTIHRYESLWPDNLFTYLVPYNEARPQQLMEQFGNKVKLVQTPVDPKGTIESLLAEVPDEEWIFWCMDDKYPIELDSNKAAKVLEWASTIQEQCVAGVTFAFMRKVPETVIPHTEVRHEDLSFLRRTKNCNPWLHQFYRASMIKEMFRAFPDGARGKELDEHQKRFFDSIGGDERRFYTLAENIVVLGESTSRGKITENCAESMRRNGFDVPETFDVCPPIIIRPKTPVASAAAKQDDRSRQPAVGTEGGQQTRSHGDDSTPPGRDEARSGSRLRSVSGKIRWKLKGSS